MSLQQAIDSVKGYACKHKDVILVAEALEEIGNLSNTKKELENAVSVARKECMQIKENLVGWKETEEAAKASVMTSKNAAKDIVPAANTEASKIIKIAELQAKLVHKDTVAWVDREKTSIRGERKAFELSKKQLVKTEKDLKLRIDELRTEMAALKGRLDV